MNRIEKVMTYKFSGKRYATRHTLIAAIASGMETRIYYNSIANISDIKERFRVWGPDGHEPARRSLLFIRAKRRVGALLEKNGI